MKKTCSTCAFAKNGNYCPLLKININPDEDTCPLNQKTLESCPICGQVMLKGTGTWSDRLKILVCDNCSQFLYSCVTCKHRKEAPQCVVEQYKGNKPPFIKVQQQQRVGFVTMTQEATQINPEVLDEVCPTCTCGNPWNCQKNHTCNNWEAAL